MSASINAFGRACFGAALGLSLLISAVAAQEATPTPAEVGRSVPDEGYNHAPAGTPLQYASNPPSSGTHYPTWTRSGVYAEQQETGYWVHSLEHGYVVILYRCSDGCPELVEQLTQFYEAAPKSASFGFQKLIVTPYPEMEHQIAVVAWTHIDEFDQFDAQRLLTFYQAYQDRGPESAP